MSAEIIRPLGFAVGDAVFERSQEIHDHHGSFQEGPHPDFEGDDDNLTQEEWQAVRNADLVLIGKLDAALSACAAMLAFVRSNEGECLGDHPAWLRRIDGIFTAHAEVIAAPVPVRNGDDHEAVSSGDVEARTGGATPPTGSIPFDTLGPFQRGYIAPPADEGSQEYADGRDFTPPYEP